MQAHLARLPLGQRKTFVGSAMLLSREPWLLQAALPLSRPIIAERLLIVELARTSPGDYQR